MTDFEDRLARERRRQYENIARREFVPGRQTLIDVQSSTNVLGPVPGKRTLAEAWPAATERLQDRCADAGVAVASPDSTVQSVDNKDAHGPGQRTLREMLPPTYPPGRRKADVSIASVMPSRPRPTINALFGDARAKATGTEFDTASAPTNHREGTMPDHEWRRGPSRHQEYRDPSASCNQLALGTPTLCHGAEGVVQRTATNDDLQVSRPADRDASPALVASCGGNPLPDEVRGQMERTMNADFLAVRIHEGPEAQAIGAQAYARGTDIFFAPGQYQPHSKAGKELLGHELAHVIQQSQGRVSATLQARGVGVDDDAGLEHEADVVGKKAACDETARVAGIAQVGGRARASCAGGPGKPVQRALNVTYTNSKWKITGRPEFRTFVRQAVCKKWNAEHPTEPPFDHNTVNLTDEELDQCHVTAWQVIRDNIVEPFLNGTIQSAQFTTDTDALYGGEQPDDYLAMRIVRTRVVEAMAQNQPTIEDVKELCALLNSATPNLRLDNHAANIKIKGHIDPHLTQTSQGASMTPKSRRNVTTNIKHKGMRLSIGGTSYWSSSLGGGTIHPSEMSPKTRGIVTGQVSASTAGGDDESDASEKDSDASEKDSDASKKDSDASEKDGNASENESNAPENESDASKESEVSGDEESETSHGEIEVSDEESQTEHAKGKRGAKRKEDSESSGSESEEIKAEEVKAKRKPGKKPKNSRD